MIISTMIMIMMIMIISTMIMIIIVFVKHYNNNEFLGIFL